MRIEREHGFIGRFALVVGLKMERRGGGECEESVEINCKYENNMILYTRCSEDVCVFLLSLPARWRGLKYRGVIGLRVTGLSLPARWRALK